MNWLAVSRKVISLAMCFLMVATPLLAQQAETKTSDYIQGRKDGEEDGEGSPAWLLAGVGCGVIGFVIAATHDPNPPATKIMGKSEEYVLGYSDGYKVKAKKQNMLYAGIGWGISAAILLAILVSSDE